MTENHNIFTWLEANGYTDVAGKICIQKQKWAEQGLKTRRNWWEVLAGDKNGNPRVIDGVAFPVLAAAQKRQGKPITQNALKLNDSEVAPGIKENTRWTKRNDAGAIPENQAVEIASQISPSVEHQSD